MDVVKLVKLLSKDRIVFCFSITFILTQNVRLWLKSQSDQSKYLSVFIQFVIGNGFVGNLIIGWKNKFCEPWCI